MKKTHNEVVEILDENFEISMADLCQSCTVKAETIIEMVEEGLIEPLLEVKHKPTVQWRFGGPSLRRVNVAIRLQRDLRVNLAGASLAIELLEEIERLKQRLMIFNENEY
jgi:chaperone modulatory protein CbpM